MIIIIIKRFKNFKIIKCQINIYSGGFGYTFVFGSGTLFDAQE